MKKRLHWIAVCILFSLSLKAQQGSIKGKLLHIAAGDEPVLNLLKQSDSSLVKATVPEADGRFYFEKLQLGNYLIVLREINYETYSSEPIKIKGDDTAITLPDIVLRPIGKELQGVTVTTAKSFVQRKIDRVVVNPDVLSSNAGTTALDVLEKSPGVTVDVNGIISMKGKQGVMVFIDDKPTYLSAADLANYLRSLPSGSLDVIELMVNAPAKYDAAGNAGIINIKLKKNIAKGMNGGISLSYGQGRYARTNNSFNFNYRISKFNFFTNIGISQNNSYQDLTINRYYYHADGSYSSGFRQQSYIKAEHGGRNAKAGFDYYASKRSTFGLVLSGFINPQKTTNSNRAQLLNETNTADMLIHSYSPSEKRWRSGSVGLNYAYKIDDKGKELTANADYLSYTSSHSQALQSNNFLPDHSLVSQSLLESSLPSDIKISSGKIDYTHPLPGIGKIDAGAKYSNVNTDNNALFYDVTNGVATPNYEFTNRFRYKEQVSAGYLNYANDWDKLSVQVGLRLEHTLANGHQLGNPTVKDSSFDFRYTSLFPTLYLQYRLDSLQTHQFGFSFGRRIDRPDYQDLNPFTYPMDRYTFYGGNPFLNPTFSYSFELSHTYKNRITTAFEYSIVTNLIQETNEQRGTIYYSRPGNFGRQNVYGFSVNANVNIAKWWMLQLYGECKNIAFNTAIYGQPLVANKWYAYIGPTNQFTINKKLSAELSGSYQTAMLIGQFLTIPVWQVRAAAAYKVLKGNATIRASIADAFYTYQPGGDIRNIANSKADWKSYLDSRVATVSFSYRFSKGKVLQARQSGAADTEKGRVKMN